MTLHEVRLIITALRFAQGFAKFETRAELIRLENNYWMLYKAKGGKI